MNRRNEYWDLIAELNQEPAALEHTVQRAVHRAKRRPWKTPARALSSLAGVCAAFALLVNVSPAFAMSCGDIPVLKELAAAVAWSPSLKNAIAHDYVQYIGQTQSADGVTVTLESAIADAKQLVLFYRAQGVENWHSLSCTLKTPDGTELTEYTVTSGTAQDELNQAEIHFTDSVPLQDMILEATLHTYDAQGEHTASYPFTFSLQLDPDKLAEKVELPVHQWVELDGQRLLVERLELSPTKTILYLDDDSANTAWLKSLDFYFTDRSGNRYDQKDSSLSATGRPESPGFYTYYLQSLYFLDDPADLTLHITGASWLDKNADPICIDLTTGQADWLPDYILELFVTQENFVSSGPQTVLNITSADSDLCLDYTYYDPEGGEHIFGSIGSSSAYTDDQGVFHPTQFHYTLEDFPFDQVTVRLNYTFYTQLAQSIDLPVS